MYGSKKKKNWYLTNSFWFTFFAGWYNWHENRVVYLVILVNHEMGDLVKSEMKDLADKSGTFRFLNLEGYTVHKLVHLMEHYSIEQKF